MQYEFYQNEYTFDNGIQLYTWTSTLIYKTFDAAVSHREKELEALLPSFTHTFKSARVKRLYLSNHLE